MQDATISLAITPSLPGMKSLSVGIASFLGSPRGSLGMRLGWGRTSLSTRRRDAHDTG